MLRHVEASAGDWIKGLRLRMKLSQRAFAQRIGVHHITVAHWETGAHRMGGRNRALLNDIARQYNYPPLAPPRKKTITLHLPDGWKEKADREVPIGNTEEGSHD